MALANTLTLALTLTLSTIYLLAGTLKLTPLLSSTAHTHLATEFPRYLLALQLDKLGMDDVTLRVLVGTLEVFCAVAMFLPGAVGVLAVVVLKIVMVGAIFTHARLGEPPYPPMILLGMLFALSTMKVRCKGAGGERVADGKRVAGGKKKSS